jgi:hypothetical protein
MFLDRIDASSQEINWVKDRTVDGERQCSRKVGVFILNTDD